jgi:hypothetical protein
MAGDLSDEVDRSSKSFKEYRRKVGPERLDAFMKEHAWLDAGKYVSSAAPATCSCNTPATSLFSMRRWRRATSESSSEPKKYRIYKAPHALSPEATRDRIAFLSEQLSFKAPPPAAIDGIPALVQPPWPQQ